MLLLSASSFIHSVYARGSLVWSLLGTEAAKVNEIWATSATSQPWALLSPWPWLTWHDLDWLGMSSGHWALEAAICSQPLAFTASLALLSSLSLLVFVVSPSVLQIKACVRDRQARGASNLFQLCCRRDSPFSSLSLPSLSILITERDQKTVSEAVFLIDAGRGDRKRLQIPGSQNYDCGLGRPSGQLQGKSLFFF